MPKPDDAELTPAQLEQRRQASTTHGAHSYLARVAGGMSITRAMDVCESAILARYAQQGPRGMVEATALWYETAAQLVIDHMEHARPDEVYSLLTLAGKFKDKAVRAWSAYAALPSLDDGAADVDALLEPYRKAANDR